ncbi:uncharacterized protein LOC106089227 [Stomoxys calcitrans]|uniref:uncharacterized protein LOC106089227 n=1 Tax=Stomoxys calcitrans TaxID=35570 RepID=UPI0027E220B9|nr:uncharacterized protein LOC106089227 [Stomoxys calcitrans]
MRYFYGASDEKFLPSKDGTKMEDPAPLSTYAFQLYDVTQDKPRFDKNDMPAAFKCTPDKLLNLCANIVDALPLPSVFEWNTKDICKWLREYGYRQYQNTFRENLINGRTLLLLDASALSAMNIKNFDHIKHLTNGIRSLFYFEMTKFARKISLHPEFHNELYKLLRIRTGPKYERARRSDLWRELQLLRKKEPNHSHWEVLEKWLGFDKDPEYTEIIGGMHRYSLYRCKAKTIHLPSGKRSKECLCLPPCECSWTDADLRSPWTVKCLPHLKRVSEFAETCNDCIPPCTCRWSSKKYMTGSVLSCLQTAFPQKYGLLLGKSGKVCQRLERSKTPLSYRLSLL